MPGRPVMVPDRRIRSHSGGFDGGGLGGLYRLSFILSQKVAKWEWVVGGPAYKALYLTNMRFSIR